MKPDISTYLKHIGKKGGLARAKTLTKKQRSEIARAGGKARQAKAKHSGGR